MESRKEEHASAVLERFDQLEWPNTKRIQDSGRQGGTFEAITATFLYFLIEQSRQFSDSVIIDCFWVQLGACNDKLKGNLEGLLEEDFVSQEGSFEALFQGLEPKKIDFGPVLKMAEEYFRHLGIAFMNPGGRRSMPCAAYSVSGVISEETEELIRTAKAESNFGYQKTVLKELSYRRDGGSCLITGMRFKHSFADGVTSETAHIVPNSAHGKADTLGCIAMFAGKSARDAVVDELNSIGNVVNLELNAYAAYDKLMWGIEAREEEGEIKYIFRKVKSPLPYVITLKDGDTIPFGQVAGGEGIEKPIPILCNLQLAVARIMHLSGAADIIFKWMDDADDEGCCSVLIPPTEFCTILDAKLSLSGGTTRLVPKIELS